MQLRFQAIVTRAIDRTWPSHQRRLAVQVCQSSLLCRVVFRGRQKSAFKSAFRTSPGGVQSDIYNQNDNPINPYSQFSHFAFSLISMLLVMLRSQQREKPAEFLELSSRSTQTLHKALRKCFDVPGFATSTGICRRGSKGEVGDESVYKARTDQEAPVEWT